MIEQKLKKYAVDVDKRLDELLTRNTDEGVLRDAMKYSLMSAGKRLRPALCLMSAGIFKEEKAALDFACCLEMIHTYSLIHDDLPAMDDDTLRRGKPTNHMVYGEGMAILAGDGLLNLAFEIMSSIVSLAETDKMLDYAQAFSIIAKASGVRGMIQGQAADLEYEGRQKNEQILGFIHERKTAAMITASILSGAVIGGADDEQLECLEKYGNSIGLVFQIVDDILDVCGDEEKLGKTVGKDENSGKQTFVSVYGIEESRKIAQRETDKAVNSLDKFGESADGLREMAMYLLSRDR